MSPNVESGDDGTIDSEDNSEIGFNSRAENGMARQSGQVPDFVAVQPGIKRVLFEDLKAAFVDCFCSELRLSKLFQNLLTAL